MTIYKFLSLWIIVVE